MTWPLIGTTPTLFDRVRCRPDSRRPATKPISKPSVGPRDRACRHGHAGRPSRPVRPSRLPPSLRSTAPRSYRSAALIGQSVSRRHRLSRLTGIQTASNHLAKRLRWAAVLGELTQSPPGQNPDGHIVQLCCRLMKGTCLGQVGSPRAEISEDQPLADFDSGQQTDPFRRQSQGHTPRRATATYQEPPLWPTAGSILPDRSGICPTSLP